MHKPNNRPNAHNQTVKDEDKYAWDYCNPATYDVLETASEANDDDNAGMAVLPENINRKKRQSGQSGFNPGGNFHGNLPSSLAGINCAGNCEKNFADKYKCEVRYLIYLYGINSTQIFFLISSINKT